MRFDHIDFLKAVRVDLPPVFSEIGIWVLNNYANRQKEKGKLEKRKQILVAIQIVQSFLEQGLDYLGKENKYNFLNKYGPKKCPDQQIRRDSLQFVYSWEDYAPLTWYENIRKKEQERKNEEERKKKGHVDVKKCNFCAAPETELRKHKVCSACKHAFYCSADCQKYDWKKQHKDQCKVWAKNPPKK